MMMDHLIMKLRRSRYTSAIFGDRVAGVADASRVTEDYATLDYPSAYVTLLSEQAEPQPAGNNENRQRVQQIWGVIVGLSATPDIRGQQPTHTIDDIRPRLIRAIYNWAPAKAYENFWYD